MRLVPLAAALIAVLLIAACGGGGASAAPSGSTLTIDLGEFKFTPQTLQVPAGQKVTLEIRNKGAVEHDFTIDAIALKAIVKPGQSAKREIGPLKAGTEYAFYCSVAGHKESGMTGKLVAK